MTISKKLLIIATLALGLNTIGFAYDAATLKTEVVQILNFAQDLQKQTSPEAKKVAKFLNKTLANTRYAITDQDIIVLANVINSNATTDAKMASVLNIKAEKQAAQNKTQHNVLKHVALNVGLITAFCTAAVISIAYDTYQQMILKIQQHDDNLLSQVQTMINNKFTNINNNKK